MNFKLLNTWVDDAGHLYIACQRECAAGEIMNRIIGPFVAPDGENVYDELRTWLALQDDEAQLQERGSPDRPSDIQELVGKPVDTSELLGRYRPHLERLRARQAEERARVERIRAE
jgi:hypothetical protein